IPLWIMQGYASIAVEIIDELKEQKTFPTHIFLQAGVGSFAAAITAYIIEQAFETPPAIIILEPHQANCYYRSFNHPTGEMKVVEGHLDSIMAGLCCGAPNTKAFKILSQYATAAISCHDELAALGMRILGNPLAADPKIISGESGAAVGIGLLHYLQTKGQKEISENLGINEESNILFINTEGDTDRENYLDVVWNGEYGLSL